MMARPLRKAWDDLTASYRRRLERQGVTRGKHQSGAPLEKARGHTSREREREASHERERENRQLVAAYQKYGPRNLPGDLLITDEHGNEIAVHSREVPAYLHQLRKRYGRKEVRRIIEDLVKNAVHDDRNEAPEPSGMQNYRQYKGTVAAAGTWYHGRDLG